MRQVLGAGALGRPRGTGCGGRWEGGSGRGTHVNPWLIHVNVWQKPLQYCKVISLQLIKINEKKKELTKESQVSPILLYQERVECFSEQFVGDPEERGTSKNIFKNDTLYCQ